jgi:hypothetical protein
MSATPQSPGRIIGLVLIAFVAGLVVLDGLMSGLYRVPDHFISNWNGQANLLTGRYPFIDSWAELSPYDEATYSGVHIASDDTLFVPRALQAIDTAMSSLIKLLGGLVVLLIAIRLLARKSVSRLARWGLLALGILIMVKSQVGPQLQVLSVNLAVQDLGYPIVDQLAGDGMTESQFPEGITPGMLGIWALTPADGLLFLTGAIIAVAGFLLTDKVRRQLPAAPPAASAESPARSTARV